MVRLNPRSFRVLNQDGAPDMMRSVEGADHVGAFLREAREAAGRSVADVVQNLRIRRVYLEAIEDGRFDELPGAAYAVGFVRSYATYLHLDAPTLVERFKEEATGIQSPQELEFPTPVPEGRFPGGLLVTLCLLLAAAAFGAWYWYQNQNSIEVARVPAPPGDAGTAATTAPVGPGSPPVAVTPAESAGAEAAAGSSMAGTMPTVETPTVESPMVETATVETATVETADTNSSEPAGDVGETDIPVVPPSYLEPQTDPLASMSQTPDLPAASDAPTETPTPDVAVETPTVVPPVEPAMPDPVVAAAPDTAQPPAEALATTPETPEVSEASEAPEVAAASPAPPAFSSEPAIVALPETATANDTPTAAATAGEGQVFGARNATARIILSARENTWVQVRDADENVVLTQMLQAGDSYRVPNRDGLRLMTGNAGGLEIQVDGDAVPAIGDRGESRRDVRLEPDLLKSGTAVVR